MSVLIDRLHFIFGRDKFASELAVKIRNQCNSILKYHLCRESNPFTNGEYLVLDTLKDQIKSFADVGANLGVYSNRLLETMEIQRGFMFEPSRKCFADLKIRFSDRRVVQVLNVALSDTCGTAQFSFDDEAGETSSLVEMGINSYAVEVTTLDTVLDSITLDLLKIDTEGYDFHVLRGAHRLLNEGKIRFVQFEYGSFWRYAGSTLYAAIKYLNGLGYQVFRIDRDGLHEHNYEKFGEFFSYSNFFACRERDLEYVKDIIRK